MSEGSLETPTRHIIRWREEQYYDDVGLDAEVRRIFDICHGCRRCFNLCDSFPTLFDLIDSSKTGELDSVSSDDFNPVFDACTLCDMCFMTKCPYVPPHEFNLDFPHLILRVRANTFKKTGTSFAVKEIAKTDRNGKYCSQLSSIVNWACKCENGITRPILESTLGIHKDAVLPKFQSKTALDESKNKYEINKSAPAFGRKAIIYATCFANYNNTAISSAACQVLAKNGVTAEVIYPNCCGMPQLEQGDITSVSNFAAIVSGELKPWIEKGYDVITLIPSCALMMKFEWPLIVPENQDVNFLSKVICDITEYIVEIAKNEGLADGIAPVEGGITIHMACHARAQNMGQKGAEMLRFIPNTNINIIERCSGHGGSWGFMKKNFDVALKNGIPAARKVSEFDHRHVVSECPLAREHLLQGVKGISENKKSYSAFQHPIELLALAYGF